EDVGLCEDPAALGEVGQLAIQVHALEGLHERCGGILRLGEDVCGHLVPLPQPDLGEPCGCQKQHRQADGDGCSLPHGALRPFHRCGVNGREGPSPWVSRTNARITSSTKRRPKASARVQRSKSRSWPSASRCSARGPGCSIWAPLPAASCRSSATRSAPPVGCWGWTWSPSVP